MLKHYQKSTVKSASTIFGGRIDSEEIVSGRGGNNLILTCYIAFVGKSFTVRESFISQLLENGKHIESIFASLQVHIIYIRHQYI